MSNKQITYLGLLLASGLIVGYIESLLPPPGGIVGAKLGLSNVVTLITLRLFGRKEALLVLTLRILLSSLLFGNLFGFAFSLFGGMAAFLAMLLSDRSGLFGLSGISILGGVFHNIGQLFVAVFLVKQPGLIYYAPLLIIAGLICGFLTGILAELILKRIRRE